MTTEDKNMIKENIDNLVNQISAGEKEEAINSFSEIMVNKVSASLENLKVDVANRMFNGVGEGVEEETDLEEGGVGGLVSFYKPGTKDINHEGIDKAGKALSKGLNNGKPIISKRWDPKSKTFKVSKD